MYMYMYLYIHIMRINHIFIFVYIHIGINPYHYDALAASQKRCPVCTEGLDGCPYCYMLPVHATGTYLHKYMCVKL
jgi:hypothetical protein